MPQQPAGEAADTASMTYYDPVRRRTLASELLMVALLLRRGWKLDRLLRDLEDLPALWRPPARA